MSVLYSDKFFKCRIISESTIIQYHIKASKVTFSRSTNTTKNKKNLEIFILLMYQNRFKNYATDINTGTHISYVTVPLLSYCIIINTVI
jgi:hypothetical protein